mgnify:FL=1
MNKCYIVRTKFVNIYDGSESFGVRVHDDYEKDYFNLDPEKDTPTDPQDLFDYCIDTDSCLDMLLDATEIEIDGVSYEVDKGILE